MLRKFYLIPALALFLLPAIARAQYEQGNWDLQIAGSGSAQQSFENGGANLNVSLGYLLTKEIEVGVRQGINYADFGNSTWAGSTFAFVQYNIDMDRWVPFIGANVGYTYGQDLQDSWGAGFEGGVKYFLNSTTYVGAVAAYEFNLQEDISEGAWLFGLALGVKF